MSEIGRLLGLCLFQPFPVSENQSPKNQKKVFKTREMILEKHLLNLEYKLPSLQPLLCEFPVQCFLQGNFLTKDPNQKSKIFLKSWGNKWE